MKYIIFVLWRVRCGACEVIVVYECRCCASCSTEVVLGSFHVVLVSFLVCYCCVICGVIMCLYTRLLSVFYGRFL